MKRLRSIDDLDSYNEKGSSSSAAKDLNLARPSSRSSSYHKPDNPRKGGGFAPSPFSSSRYDRDRSGDEDAREGSRMVRKRSDHDFDGADRRKGLTLGFDRYGGGGGSWEGHNGNSGSGDRGMHRSESFCGGSSRGREFPKGFRSERERSRREGSVSTSWRRFGSGSKEFEESGRGIGFSSGSRGGANEERGRESRSSPKGLKKDVKSPTWSRDSGSEQTRAGAVSRSGGVSGRDEGKVKSSYSKSRSSPTWSKDSESEQSKSVEVGKKSVEVETKSVEVEVEVDVKSVESEAKVVEIEVKGVEGGSGSGSEMEEGELEREPDFVDGVAEGNDNDKVKNGEMDDELDVQRKEEGGETQTTYQASDGSKEAHKASVSEGKDGVNEVDEMPKHEENANDDTGASEGEVRNVGGDEMQKDSEPANRTSGYNEEESKEVDAAPEVESKRGKGFDLEAKVEDIDGPESNKESMEENGGADLNLDMMSAGLGQHLKEKGKSVAVSPSHIADSAKDSMQIERESGNVENYRDREDDMEGPSARGFELFSTSPVRRVEKAEQSGVSRSKDDRLTLEPLDLSLSLPNVLLPIGATRDSFQAPGSPSQGRSVQSFSTFHTNSDGFTASMSFSGSQSFFHNPSCSLTQNSLDMDNFEQSVHSRPIFQGIDQGTLQNDSKHKDVPLYQRILGNGNGSLTQSQALQGVTKGQASQGSSKMPNGLERQLSLHQQLSTGQVRNHEDTKSPAQSIGSHDIGSTYSFEKKQAMREKHAGSLYRSSSQKEKEPLLIGGPEFVENFIRRIVSDPIYVMARKFHEMSAQFASILKESIGDIMVNADKQGQLCAFQSALQSRSDLTLDMLLKAHPVQLEILVALKTGLKEYLQVDSSISSSDLADIFLNLRCRNHACRSPLPVDECDCKVCSKKSGFCSACMCLVCSKFDMASNTCSWIGCDVCLHWCHADCALRESFIRNGRSVSGVQGPPEMQFHCVACDHPSEMFGFVKEVFQNFAKEWSVETFCKELEYVRRIFSASKDPRGRYLYKLADQMLAKLANKSTLPDVYSFTMGFFNESDFSKFANTSTFSGKEQGSGSNGVVAGPSQDPSWFKSVHTEKNPQVERSDSLLPSFRAELNDKHLLDSKSHRSIQKEPLFDELESIVRVKQVEAEMFQARADDARREAEGLRRIAVAKNEKIEEEYNSRITKLRLGEAEEMRKQKFEEFQAFERAHREYFGMKMRMEADINDLLSKMEATKRNLAM